jgi:hypothetical protein
MMTALRALFLASLLGGLVVAGCGGAGSGGPGPALGTNNPAGTPSPSGDPYSDDGY